MRHRLHRLALSFALALTFLGQASALLKPLGSSTETFYRRQAAQNPASETVVTQTVQTIETNVGPATETCVITFTPITGARGEPLVQVVRQCNVVPGAASQSTSTLSSASLTSTTSISSTSTTKSLSSAQSTSTTTSVSSSVSSAQSTSTTTSASSSVSSAIVFSSVPITPVSSSSSSTPTSSVTSNPDPLPTTSPSPPPSANATPASSTANGAVTAADSASTSPSASAQSSFQIPGKKISVLPIGLGIFAGISVIALIVVGLVTYERTKYRKIFRQRKLAEQGERIGYSGLP